MSVRVLVVDDQPAIRASLCELLEVAEDVSVVGEAGNGDEAVALARVVLPSVVVLDLRMPHRDGLWAIDTMRADPLLADTRILVLTTFENDQNVVTALQKGANGFIGKTAPQETLIEAVRTVASGGSWLSTAAATSVVQYLNATAYGQIPSINSYPGVDDLTQREREVLIMVGRGLTNVEIADELTISQYTVKTHVNRAMMKLGVADRSGLVVIAYRSGLVPSSDCEGG
uniref:response regulator n=1 Tax=Rhodococcus qingshengii TaxID=334542 RepID=UPI001C4DF183|nr:response regulator transcription factor [Rhodococcus qingshengii]